MDQDNKSVWRGTIPDDRRRNAWAVRGLSGLTSRRKRKLALFSRASLGGGWTVGVLILAAAAALAEPAEVPLGLDAFMPVPPENPVTTEKATLGRRLFFDPILSKDETVSCGTCHEPKYGFTDREPLAVGLGGQKGTRRTPRLINRGYGRGFFWDGRADSLEDQVLKPIANPIEMDLTLADAVARLKKNGEYTAAFQEAFGTGPTPENLALALATYVRTIVSGNSAYDRYVAGDREALSDSARRGLELFRGKAGCVVCHLGPNLTDEEFHNTGVGWNDGIAADLGRAEVTGKTEDRGAFKTPTLREVASAGPYMHDGSLATLEDVIEFYDEGGEPNPHLDLEMQPLDLNDGEKVDLVAFLKALSGTVTDSAGAIE